MSDFSQLMVGGVLALIFGVWVAIVTNIWENGSVKVKAFIVTVSVISFLSIVGLAVYNGWISFPEIPAMNDTQIHTIVVAIIIVLFIATRFVLMSNAVKRLKTVLIGRIFIGIIGLVLSAAMILSIYILGSMLIEKAYYNLNLWGIIRHFEYTSFSMCLMSVILSNVLPFVEYFILKIDMTPAGILSVPNALIIGTIIYFNNNAQWAVSISWACLSVLIEYEILSLFTTRHLASPFGMFKWIADAFVDLFT